MTDQSWFTHEAEGARDVAVITDDLTVEIDQLGTVTIWGWEGGHVHLDLTDAIDVAAVLSESARLLRDRGFRTATDLKDRT